MSESDERYTPDHVLDVVRAFAPIEYDPCAAPHNPADANAWSVKEVNGLDSDWHRHEGLVYVNPPYSRGQLKRWADKAAQEALCGGEIIMLTPSDLSTDWADLLVCNAQNVAFWKRRIAFGTPTDPQGVKSGAKQPSSVWYFGERSGRFERVFAPHAHVLALPNPVRLALPEAAQ